jgi:hypothetical protein
MCRRAGAIADRFLAVARRILRGHDLAEDATQQALLASWHGADFAWQGEILRDSTTWDRYQARLSTVNSGIGLIRLEPGADASGTLSVRAGPRSTAIAGE